MSVAESLAVAHALRQTEQGFLCGRTNGKWTKHLFCDKGNQNSGLRHYFARFEYQDGGPHHEYGKGRGTLHLHAVFWFWNLRAVGLEEFTYAHFSARRYRIDFVGTASARWCASALTGVGRTVQLAENIGWHLLPAVEAHGGLMRRASLRAFVAPLFRIFRCHIDVQWWQTSFPLLTCVTGYVAKLTESVGTQSGWMTHVPLGTQALLAFHTGKPMSVSKQWCWIMAALP